MILLSLLANPVNIFVLKALPTTINGTNPNRTKDIGHENINAITIAAPKFEMLFKRNPIRTPVAYLRKIIGLSFVSNLFKNLLPEQLKLQLQV